MSESAMFRPEYAKSLPTAPRIFKVGEIIHLEEMPPISGLWEKQDEGLTEYEIEIDPPMLPEPLVGRVVMVFQLKKGGAGHIRVRFGDRYLAEWHFREKKSKS